MKLKKVLLRWYKSFHLNYRGIPERGEVSGYRPWNKIAPSYAPDATFPFIEIPIENDITTIVGANESGKSHLLNAICKVVRGTGIDPNDSFKRTDLCHYAGVRTKNVEAWPNLGLQFELSSREEADRFIEAATGAKPSGTQTISTFTLILAPDTDGHSPAQLFVEPNEQPLSLSHDQLIKARKHLPSVQFIDSHALLPSEIPLAWLISAYGDPDFSGISLIDRKSLEEAANAIQQLSIATNPEQNAVSLASKLEQIKATINKFTAGTPRTNSLEMHLFKDIIGINVETLKYLYNLTVADRGYIEGQVAKWNEEINDKLNLSHFWRQDEQFSLTVNYKDGVIYFEIHDKTDSIYTFKERSSGLKFFLSYYIQAKAMELASRNRNSIILMDEPDSALSILGQRNLLAVFESLVSPETSGQTCQLIYTTHSPYLINRNFPRRIRVVKKEDAEEGTQYIEQARARRYEPVRTALGIDSAPSLFLGADNILLEGPTDQFLISELIRVFATPENVGEFIDLNSVVMVSADGVGNIENVLEQSRWADEPVPPTAVILDNDPAGHDTKHRVTGAGGKRKALLSPEYIAPLGDLVRPFDRNRSIVTTEDLVPAELYVEAIRRYVKKWLPATVINHGAELEELLVAEDFGESKGLVAATKELFSRIKPEFAGDYDKMGVFQEVIAIVGEQSAKDDESIRSIRKNIIAVCDFVREALGKSRAATAKHSTTQAVKRIINDFNRLNRDNVPVTNLQRLFRRLEREVSPIGTDGEEFIRVANGYLKELEELRSAGQERVVKDAWAKWKHRIDSIKRNPLSISEAERRCEAAMLSHPENTASSSDNSLAQNIPTSSV